MAETVEDAKAAWEMEEGKDDREEARVAMLGVLGGEVSHGSRGLLPGAEAAPLRDRGDSNEDSDSSAVSSDEEKVKPAERANVAHVCARARKYCSNPSCVAGVAAYWWISQWQKWRERCVTIHSRTVAIRSFMTPS